MIVLRLVRSLRIVRVIRLAMHIPVSDRFLTACTYPARVICNAFLLLAIALYIFANIGVALFPSVEFEVRKALQLQINCPHTCEILHYWWALLQSNARCSTEVSKTSLFGYPSNRTGAYIGCLKTSQSGRVFFRHFRHLFLHRGCATI